uniref:EF-hand domain-containing protein n=1 Tax=Strombidium inclinatum TaxID=197538 RepID=A0A7S3MZI8_9SPIT|mmetsp:Transcript_25628/g.39433  ORF Transcript_25628/g.39433 Transcript_25628/m.39433 type:complete len:293 (+) Transcript_25628:1-879(+)
MAFFGVDAQVRIDEINHQFRNILRQKGGYSVAALRNTFTKFDINGNGKLDLPEFEEALGDFGFFPKQVDLKALFKYYDANGDGQITYTEFLNALSDQRLSERKSSICHQAWSILDPKDSGFTTGKAVIDQAKCMDKGKAFLELFSETKGEKMDGKISQAEFFNQCLEISVVIPNDEYFVQHFEQLFSKVCELGETKIRKDRVMHTVMLIRQRLITLSNDKQEEYVLRNMFRTFDLDQSGSLTLNELAGLMAKLGVEYEHDLLLAVMRELDTNKSGVIEFEEFCQFLIINPYK